MHLETETNVGDSACPMNQTDRKDVEVKVEPIRLTLKQNQNG